MAIVGLLAFLLAYSVVGWLYELAIISGRETGSLIHWVLRTIIFIAIYYIVATAIRNYYWIVIVPVYIYGAVIMIAVIGIIVMKILKYNKENYLIREKLNKGI